MPYMHQLINLVSTLERWMSLPPITENSLVQVAWRCDMVRKGPSVQVCLASKSPNL